MKLFFNLKCFFWKINLYLGFVASLLALADAAFPKSSTQLTTTMERLKSFQSPNPLFEQSNLISQASDFPISRNPSGTDKRSTWEARYADSELADVSIKKSSKDPFVNVQREQSTEIFLKESSPDKRNYNTNESCASASLANFPSSDWGDELMWWASEGDNVPEYLMLHHPIDLHYDQVPITFLDFENQYEDLQNQNYWEIYNELLHQPGILGDPEIDTNKGACALVPENQNYEESNLANNVPPSKPIELELTAGILENNTRTLEKKKQHIEHSKATDTHIIGVKRIIPSEISDPSSKEYDLNNSQTSRNEKKHGIAVKMVEVPPGDEKKQALGSKRVRKRQKSVVSIDLTKITQNNKSSFEENAAGSLKVVKNPSKGIINTGKEESLEKMLKDSVDHFKLESKDLKKTRSKKIPLELFFKTIDSYADSKLINSDLIQRWIQTMGVKYSEKSLINLFLSHKKVAISRSLIVKFQEVFKNQLSKELENSVQNFLDSVEAQIRKNCGEVFYIANHQVNSFLASLPGMYFKVREKSLEGNSGEHKSQNINKLANIIVGSLDSISWTNLFSADENLKLFEKREIILKSQRFQNSEHSYKTFLNMRFTLRKLFLVYSTIINKIFCEGEKDLMENFLERQKNAISFFDTAWKLLEVDDDGLFFIDNDRLPLNGGIKEEFLSTYYLNSARRHPVGSFQFKFTNKRVCKIDVQWKIIALWLAGRRLELYKIFYTRDRKTINSMFKLKNFINSVFLCLLRG